MERLMIILMMVTLTVQSGCSLTEHFDHDSFYEEPYDYMVERSERVGFAVGVVPAAGLFPVTYPIGYAISDDSVSDIHDLGAWLPILPIFGVAKLFSTAGKLIFSPLLIKELFHGQ